MLHGAGIFTYMTGWFIGEMLVNIIVESWGIWACASYFLCGLFMFLEHLPTRQRKNAQGALDVLCYVICIDMRRLQRLQVRKSGPKLSFQSRYQSWKSYSMKPVQQGFLQGGKSPAVRSCHLWPHGQLYSEANYNVLWEVDDHRATLQHRPCRFLHYPGQNMWFSKAQTEPNMSCILRDGCFRKWVWQPIWLVVWNIFYFFVPYIGNNHPNWRSYFSEGLKPPTSNIFLFYCAKSDFPYPPVIKHDLLEHPPCVQYMINSGYIQEGKEVMTP